MEPAARPREAEFERALVDVLSMDYDLRVRVDPDGAERRRNGYATLLFDYHHSDAHPGRCKVIVRVRGMDGFSSVFHVDLTNLEAILGSAERCESLALAIMEQNERWALSAAEGRYTSAPNFRRRSDD